MTSLTFIEERFPTDISYGATGGPQFSTDIVATGAGYEQRNANWQMPLARYNLAHGVKTEVQLLTLISFFRACQGRAIGFRFKDWMDYRVVNQAIGIGDDKTSTFPLYATYQVAKLQIKRRIYKIVPDTFTLRTTFRQYGPTEYKVDYEQGVVSLYYALDADVQLFASFEFDIPARFDTDHLTATMDNFGLNSWHNIPIVEIRTSYNYDSCSSDHMQCQG